MPDHRDARQDPAAPEVGIVTVLFASDDVIQGFFESLALQRDVRFRLYIIENSPTPAALDRCRELAVQHGIDAEFVFNNANLGVAKGNNQGIELALRDGCRHVLLANNDTEFAAGALSALLKPLRSGEERVTTPKFFYPGPGRRIWYAGGSLDLWTMRTPHWGMLQEDHGQFDHINHPGYAPTCFMMIDARVFETVGLMDERYFVYYDDTDFVWRMHAADIRIRMVPLAEVVHKVATSTGGARSPFTVYYSNRNRIYFIRKNLHGLRGLTALAYVLLTRIPSALALPRPVAARLWAGVRDGFRLTTAPHER